MSAPSLAIVTPTLNEAGNIETLVSKLLELEPRPSIYVMDDGSTDGTLEGLEAIAAANPSLHRIRRTGARGYGRACVDGLERALEGGAELVLQMDADLSHDPRYIPSMLAASSEADLVLGSRYVDGISVVRWSLRRLMLSTAANRYVRSLAGLRPQDCTTGFRLWSASLLRRMDLDTIRSEGYGFLVETLFRASRLGARIVEVPIIFVERESGESKLSSRVFVESALLPWRLLARRLFG
ncbi:MAG: polyprenol monophosphomannose synthase [Acidobacteriota bacterium]